jgi:hypothetical protein
VLISVFLDDHRDHVARGLLVQMKLLGVGAVPRAERAAEDHAFPAGKKHLRGARGEAVVAGQIAAFVGKADIADAGAHIGELPGPPSILVVGPCRELPSDGGRIFNTAFRLAVDFQEIAGSEGSLANDLRDDFVVEQTGLELAPEMRGVLIDLGFGLLNAKERVLLL